MKLKYSVMESPNHKRQKEKRLAMMKAYRTSGNFSNSHDYLVVANRISGKKRMESRMRVNKIMITKAEQKNGK